MDYIAERSVVKTYLKDLLVHEKVIEMKNYIQHGSITTYHHCFDVQTVSDLANRISFRVAPMHF